MTRALEAAFKSKVKGEAARCRLSSREVMIDCLEIAAGQMQALGCDRDALHAYLDIAGLELFDSSDMAAALANIRRAEASGTIVPADEDQGMLDD